MNTLRRTRQSLAAILLLLVLGLQVQATFACEVADFHGTIENCCCKGEDAQEPLMSGAGCCEYSQDLTLKGTDPAEDSEPVTLGKSPDVKPPPMLVAMLAVWLAGFRSTPLPSFVTDSDLSQSPGTRTWLTTQRLRI